MLVVGGGAFGVSGRPWSQFRAQFDGRKSCRWLAGPSFGPSWRPRSSWSSGGMTISTSPNWPEVPAKSVAKLAAKGMAKWTAGLSFRPSGWPSWRPSPSWSITRVTTWRSSVSLQPCRPLTGLARDRGAWRGPWSGLNAQKCPKCTFQRGGVEVLVQTSVEVLVEGAGARWERISENREWDTVPGRHFFRSGARIGNLTGKVTGNPEAHDRGGASRTADSTASWRKRS